MKLSELLSLIIKGLAFFLILSLAQSLYSIWAAGLDLHWGGEYVKRNPVYVNATMGTQFVFIVLSMGALLFSKSIASVLVRNDRYLEIRMDADFRRLIIQFFCRAIGLVFLLKLANINTIILAVWQRDIYAHTLAQVVFTFSNFRIFFFILMGIYLLRGTPRLIELLLETRPVVSNQTEHTGV